MELGLFWTEKALLVVGVLFILTGIVQYGRRSHDWKGVVTMFYKRVPMNVGEYKRYRLGVAFVIFAVVLRFALHVLWPQYTL
ncbi:hypothetical protein ACPV5O_14330 [Vibrio maritimus]|nr:MULTISPECIES: hypothetical protein [Vibrio]USD63877.1 hypothetical protein J4N45_22070 [Vibrio sp. SCSIO 43140]